MLASDRRTAVRLEWATIVWNLGEFFVTVGLGIAAGSIALIAFGVDSLIEVFASLVVVWHQSHGEQVDAKKTALAHRLIAIAFFLLAVALVVSSVRRLIVGIPAEESPWGIAYLILVVIAMGVLAVWKQRIAKRIDSSPLAAEARVTYLDALLASLILSALVINAVLGWWWTDPLAALVVAGVAFREGLENLEDEAEDQPGL